MADGIDLERIARALEQGIKARPLGDGTWYVTSGSRPGAGYIVAGGRCSCPAGRNGRACKHAALAALLATVLDDGETDPKWETDGQEQGLGADYWFARGDLYLANIPF